MSEVLTDILFAVTESMVGVTFTIELPISGSIGSPVLIESQTVFFELKISGEETISII